MKVLKIYLEKSLFVGLFLIVGFLLFSCPVKAAQEGDYTYTVTNGEAQITKYTGISSAVTTPDTLGGYPVTKIGDGAFYYNQYLTSITISSNVKTIGQQAISACPKLTNVSFSEGLLSIGRSAFDKTPKLLSVSFPNSLLNISDSAFSYCTSLSDIYIPFNVTTIGEAPFNGCSNLKNITVDTQNLNYSSKEGILYDKAKTTLIECPIGVTSVNLPLGLKTIGNSSFSQCKNLTTIVIPQGATSIGSGAFSYCTNITKITIPDSVQTISSSAFQYCSSLVDINLPYGIEKISSSLFYNCTSLTNITVPTSVKTIEYGAFQNCYKINNINISQGISIIGSFAFDNCPKLTNISIPESVSAIGEFAFRNCISLNNISIPSQVRSVSYASFANCTSLQNISLPDSLYSIGDYAFSNCPNLINVSLPVGLTNIGIEAFSKCSKLNDIVIPEGVTNIAKWTFSGCTSLGAITIKSPTTSIYDDPGTIPVQAKIRGFVPSTAYEFATKYNRSFEDLGPFTLTSISISNPASKLIYKVSDQLDINGLVVTGTYKDGSTKTETIALANISGFDSSKTATDQVLTINVGSMKTTYVVQIVPRYDFTYTVVNSEAQITGYIGSGGQVTIPSIIDGYSVTSIGENAFLNKTSITSISIPTSVKSINKNSFKGCSGLTGISIPSGVTEIADGTFYGCSSLANVNLPIGITSIDAYAFYSCTNLQTIVIPETVTTIGEYAFYGCSHLNTVTLPPTVVNIGTGAFYDCPVVTSVSVPVTTTVIPDNAYTNWTGLTNIIIPESVLSIGKSSFSGCNALQTITFLSPTTTIYDEDATISVQATIRGFTPSTAKDYATKYNRKFEDIGTYPLTQIAITKPASKLIYDVGESLDISGLEVTGTFSNGTTKIQSITDANISGFDSTKPIKGQVLTITIEDKTTSYVIDIRDAVPPVLNVPSDITAEATGILSPISLGEASATDDSENTVSLINNAPIDGYPLGITTVTWTATDSSGNKTTANQNVMIVDTTAPEFTSIPSDITAIMTSSKTPIDIGLAIASDIFPTTIVNNAPADGFDVGTTLVTWSATDANGNTATATQKITIGYEFSGFLNPINSDGSSIFKSGRTIPVKFQLKDASGNYVPSASATLSYSKITDQVLGTEYEAESTAAATTGNLFRYDSSSNQYIFNMSTKDLTSGTYQLKVKLSDGKEYTVNVSLK